MPVVVNDEIAIRLMLPLSISYDHRLGEGAAAARFLNDMIGYLKRLLMKSENAPGLPRGSLRSLLQKRHDTERDATGLPRGRSRSSPVTSVIQATNVRIQGTSPWHSDFLGLAVFSCKRKDPRDEPVAFAIIPAVSSRPQVVFY